MGRTPCTKDGMNKGAWTAEEDKILIDYINAHGEGKWRRIPKESGLKRCGKSCRLRWLNYLRPDIKRGNITRDEEDLIIRLHKLLGNRWSLIAGRLPGRTDNEIKNYWNTNLSKRVHGKQKSGPSSGPFQERLLVGQEARPAAFCHPPPPSAAESESSDGSFSSCALLRKEQNGSDPLAWFDYRLSEYLPSDSLEFGSEIDACVGVDNSDCCREVFSQRDVGEINKNKSMDSELGSLDEFFETEEWLMYP